MNRLPAKRFAQPDRPRIGYREWTSRRTTFLAQNHIARIARMNFFRRTIALFIVICAIDSICAQCAPGIPTAGNPGCVPPTAPGSPYALPGENPPGNLPVPQQVRWADSWGAIAYDRDEAKAGNAEDQPSKDAANETAIDYCHKNGGNTCRIVLSYHNQCASAAQRAEGGGMVYFSSAAEQSDADANALRRCGTGCITVLSKCSLPRRIE